MEREISLILTIIILLKAFVQKCLNNLICLEIEIAVDTCRLFQHRLVIIRMQTKSVLQLAIHAGSYNVQAQKSFQPAPKTF